MRIRKEKIMTDKEIIIDGGRMSGITYLKKQLARKTQECEELKKANIHIDNNKKCKAKKLKEIEQLLIDCSSGYTDEVMQKIMEIIHKPETVCFENKYEQALNDVEQQAKKTRDIYMANKSKKGDYYNAMIYGLGGLTIILDIISKAKDDNNEK